MTPPVHRHRTISIGGATYDLFVTMEQPPTKDTDGKEAFTLPLGKKIWIKTVFGTVGGGAANTSVGLSRLGCAANFCGVVSDDQWGQQITANFAREGVDCAAVTVVEDEPSNFSIVLSSPGGERTILAHHGTSRHLHDVTFDRERVSGADWVYLNNLHADSCVIEDDLVAILTVPDAPSLTWNPGSSQVEAGLAAANNRLIVDHADLLLLNKEESLQFADKSDPASALRLLLEAGAKAVCITDGKNGSMASDGTHVYRCPAPHCPVVDTTGAGDAFGTGMTWGLMTGKGLPESLKAGTINAMSVVGAVGAQPGLLTEAEMRTRLESIKIDIEIESL